MNGFWLFRPQNLVVAWWVDRNRWLWKFYLRQAPRVNRASDSSVLSWLFDLLDYINRHRSFAGFEA
jgi:hypothetical protein